MKPHFFFQGKLSREESASAFLATLLDQHSEFRSFFYKSLKIDEPASQCLVSIEQKEVDIRLEYPAAGVIVLIENKVRPGALQVNQLVRYYQQERAANANARIISIMISPSAGSGSSEAVRLTKHKDFRPTDAVLKLSWRDLAEYCDIIKDEDPSANFLKGGFASILKIIDDAAQEKYPLTEGRIVLHTATHAALAELTKAFPGMRLGFWRGKDLFNIYSMGCDITAFIDLIFRVESAAPYAPLDVSDPQKIVATIRTQFTLSAKGRRNHPLRDEWSRLCAAGEYEIPGLGPHKLSGRWFKKEAGFSGNIAELERELAERARIVIAKANELQRLAC